MASPPIVKVYAAVVEEACVVATAFSYFSRLPIPARVGFSEQRLARAGRYISLVGIVIGTLGAGVYLFAGQFLPANLAVLLAMATTMLASGALHEDGLADCCDGFGGARSREDVLRVMKDSRIGAFGAIGLLISQLIRWQALTTLASVMPLGAALWLIAGHAASRAGAVVYMSQLDYARADGKASAFGKPSWRSAAVALVIGLPWLFWGDWQLGWLIVTIGFFFYLALGKWFTHRLGGYTGDCLGLAQQVFEILTYLIVIGWIST